MDYIKQVTTNLKGASRPVDMHPRTLLIGENGSGKSRLWQAIELALTARVGDVAGKDEVSRPADLLALVPGREGELFSRVVTDQGETAACSLRSKGAGSATRPLHELSKGIDAARVLPLRRLKEATSGTPEKARRFFLDEACGVTSHADVLRLLPKTFHADYAKLAGKTIFADLLADPRDAVTLLLEVKTKAHATVLQIKRDLKANETILEQSSGGNSAAYVTVVDITQAAAHVATLAVKRTEAMAMGQARSAALAHNATVDAYAQYDAQQTATNDALRVELVKAEAKHAEALAALAALPADNIERQRRAAAIAVLMRRVIETDATACGLCGTENVPGIVERSVKLMPLMEQAATDATRKRGDQLVVYWANTVNNYRMRVNAVSSPAGVGGKQRAVVPEDVDIGAINTQWTDAVTQLADMRASRQAWQIVHDARGKVEAYKDRRDWWTRFEEGCDTVIGDLLTVALDNFQARVQKHLPKGDTFGLQLTEGDRDVVQYGLWREYDTGEGTTRRVLHTALSGAEWAWVTAALACALTKEGEFAVICPEERAFTPKTLRRVMIALNAAPCQVILCSPIGVRGQPPRGWTVINVEKEVDIGVKASADADNEDADDTEDWASVVITDRDALHTSMGAVTPRARELDSAGQDRPFDLPLPPDIDDAEPFVQPVNRAAVVDLLG